MNKLNTTHLLKVTALWISAVYVICFLGVFLFPGIRPDFMMYALHMKTSLGENVMTIGTFVSGIIIWNITALIGVWLFAFIFNTIKK